MCEDYEWDEKIKNKKCHQTKYDRHGIHILWREKRKGTIKDKTIEREKEKQERKLEETICRAPPPYL